MSRKDKKLIKSAIVVILLVGAFLALNKFMYNTRGAKGNENIMANTQNLNSNAVSNIEIEVVPIEHATMVLKWGGKVIYTDPVGGAGAFLGQPAPDLILLTDIHGDHLDIKTLEAVSKDYTGIIAPMDVADKLPGTIAGTLLVMRNGEKTNQKTNQKMNLNGFSVEAIPMYNLPQIADSYHVKGRGNGYVIGTQGEQGKRVYISGDTSDIPEMRNLKNIDMAFVAMNLPYTMSVDSAASAVLAFKPKQVYPYHYRGTDGLSDVNKFKELVNKGDPNIDVVLLDWYPK